MSTAESSSSAPTSRALASGEEVMKAARQSEEREARKVWLHAWHDPLAGLKAFTPCVRFADLNGDGDAKMLVASADKKLKIYTGTCLLYTSPSPRD